MLLLQSRLVTPIPFLLTFLSLVTARPHPNTYNALARRENAPVDPQVSIIHDDSGARAVHVDIGLDNVSDDREIDLDFHIHLGPHLSTQGTIGPPLSDDVHVVQPPEGDSSNENTPPPQVLCPGTHPSDDLSNRDNLLLNSTSVLYYEAPKGDGKQNISAIFWPVSYLDVTITIQARFLLLW